MFLLKITISGHFYLGSSLLELDKVDEAIKHLQTAFELGKKDPSSYYDDTIPSKLRWMLISKISGSGTPIRDGIRYTNEWHIVDAIKVFFLHLPVFLMHFCA
jgi:hypothetical protein